MTPLDVIIDGVSARDIAARAIARGFFTPGHQMTAAAVVQFMKVKGERNRARQRRAKLIARRLKKANLAFAK